MVAVETREENEFIKRVLDVEEKDMPGSDNWWNLGGKRVGNEVIWVQTGNRIGSANWHVWYSSAYDLSRRGINYVKMLQSIYQRKWYFNSDNAGRFICEAS